MVLDDSPEIFKIRLASFKQNTLPMLKNLDERGKLKVVRAALNKHLMRKLG